MTRGILKSSFSSYICHEELNKRRDPMLQCWEGSELAVFSEDVDDSVKCSFSPGSVKCFFCS